MQDWAFTSIPISVIDNYSSVPWKHYKLTTSDVILNSLIIPTYNSSDNAKLLTSVDSFCSCSAVSISI